MTTYLLFSGLAAVGQAATCSVRMQLSPRQALLDLLSSSMLWSKHRSRTHHVADFAEPDLKDLVRLTSAARTYKAPLNAIRG